MPVPTMRRERKVRPAMTKGSAVMTLSGTGRWALGVGRRALGVGRPATGCAAAHEIDDLDLVALADRRRVERGAPHDREIVLDGDAPGIDAEVDKQRRDRERAGDLDGFSVEADRQGRSGAAPAGPAARSRAEERFKRAYRAVGAKSRLSRLRTAVWQGRVRALPAVGSIDLAKERPLA